MNNLLAYGLAGAGSTFLSGGLSYLTGRRSQEYASELQYKNWKKMFDYEANYNKPINQLSRSAAVGVNPFVSPAGAQMVGASSQQVGAPAAAPGASPIPFDFGSNFSQILQGLLNLRSSQGKEIENTKLADWFDSQIRDKLVHAGYEEVMTQGQQLANEITQLYGKMEKRAVISRLMKDTLLKASQIMLNDDLGDLAAQQRLESMAKEAHARAQSVLGQKDIDAFDTRLNAWLHLVQSQRAANYSSAEMSRESAETERQLRSGRVDAQTLENGLSAIDFMVNDQMSLKERQLALEKLSNETELIAKENNVFYWRFAAEMLRAVVDGVVSASAAGKILRGAKGARSVQEVKNKVGNINEYVSPPSEKGSGAPVFPRDKDKFPNLYMLWQSGKH